MNGFINTTNLTATQRIERVNSLMMADPHTAQFGPLILFAGVRVGQCPTAYTDGRRIVLGEGFIGTLTDSALAYVILHEGLHIAYRHLFVWRELVKKSARVANQAMDYVINLQLDDISKRTRLVEMPVDKDGKPIGLLNERFRGMDTREVFDILYDENKKGQQNKGDGQPGESGQSGEDDGEDGHGGFDEHDHDAAEGMTADEEQTVKKEVEQAIRHGSNLAGKLGGNVDRDLQRVLESHFDWREALADYVRAAFSKGHERTTFRRFNRRLQASGIYMPSTYDDAFRRLVVGIDTSGSIGGDILAKFLGHVVKVIEDVKPEEVILLYWDTSVCRDERYGGGVSYDTMLASTKPVGGGGTDPRCVADYLRNQEIENVECVLLLTDGVFFGDHGDWDGLQVLWCVLKNYYDRFTCETGHAIPVE